jgi:hypothetical protein
MSEEELQFETEPDAALHASNKENDGDVRARLALQMLKQVRDGLTHVIGLLETGDTAKATRHMVGFVTERKNIEDTLGSATGARVLEGFFDGASMLTSDGERHNVPENYASKSKLVEGDVLKLTIRSDGSYLYKQIGPVDRKRIVGKLGLDSGTNEYVVTHNDGAFKVLGVSVSYFKGVPGDEVVVIVPSARKSSWAAIERIG